MKRATKPAESLLDRAVKEHSIPPWPYEAFADRIVVFMVPEVKAARDTFVEGGKIVKLETRQSAEKAETPRGIVVSAGLQARDVMHSHGIGLGHMVWVARHSPWRHQVDKDSDGKDIEFFFLRVGDIVGSEDTLKSITKGDLTVEQKSDGTHTHKFKGEDARPRFDPPSYLA